MKLQKEFIRIFVTRLLVQIMVLGLAMPFGSWLVYHGYNALPMGDLLASDTIASIDLAPHRIHSIDGPELHDYMENPLDYDFFSREGRYRFRAELTWRGDTGFVQVVSTTLMYHGVESVPTNSPRGTFAWYSFPDGRTLIALVPDGPRQSGWLTGIIRPMAGSLKDKLDAAGDPGFGTPVNTSFFLDTLHGIDANFIIRLVISLLVVIMVLASTVRFMVKYVITRSAWYREILGYRKDLDPPQRLTMVSGELEGPDIERLSANTWRTPSFLITRRLFSIKVVKR